MRCKTNATPAALTANEAAIPILVPVAVELIAASALSTPGRAGSHVADLADAQRIAQFGPVG
jgi:hypothetical protein